MRKFEIRTKGKKGKRDKIHVYELLCKGFSSDKFTERYFDLKNSDECMHLDYLVKKEIVRESKDKTLQILNLRKIGSGKNPDNLECTRVNSRKITNIQQDIFNNVLPNNHYSRLCKSLNWTKGFISVCIDDRMIIGLGNSNVAETSMTIHHTYGIPYIPGQAIKGVFRNYFLTEILDSDEKEVNGKEVDYHQLYQFIFGECIDDSFEKVEQGNTKGSVVFFDAFPDESCDICQDIMTPHYSEYYSHKDKFPMDTENPVPIPFFVVKEASLIIYYAIRNEYKENYSFIVSDQNNKEENHLAMEELNSFIHEKLQKALEEHGMGAKTAVGYGVLKKDEALARKVKEAKEQEMLEEKRKQREAIMQSMSEVERDLYIISEMPEQQKESAVPNLIKQYENRDLAEQKVVAQYVKKYYLDNSKWKVKQSEIEKGKKHAEKVVKICTILGEDLPISK